MSLEQTYREIADALGGSIVGDRYNKTFLRVQGVDTMLDTIDGLMEVWNEYCKPKGWEWFRQWESTPQGSPVDKWIILAARNKDDGKPDPITPQRVVCSGNFHADFARLLAAVLKEIARGEKS